MAGAQQITCAVHYARDRRTTRGDANQTFGTGARIRSQRWDVTAVLTHDCFHTDTVWPRFGNECVMASLLEWRGCASETKRVFFQRVTVITRVYFSLEDGRYNMCLRNVLLAGDVSVNVADFCTHKSSICFWHNGVSIFVESSRLSEFLWTVSGLRNIVAWCSYRPQVKQNKSRPLEVWDTVLPTAELVIRADRLVSGTQPSGCFVQLEFLWKITTGRKEIKRIFLQNKKKHIFKMHGFVHDDLGRSVKIFVNNTQISLKCYGCASNNSSISPTTSDSVFMLVASGEYRTYDSRTLWEADNR